MNDQDRASLKTLEDQLRAAQAASDQGRVTTLTAQIAAFKTAHP